MLRTYMLVYDDQWIQRFHFTSSHFVAGTVRVHLVLYLISVLHVIILQLIIIINIGNILFNTNNTSNEFLINLTQDFHRGEHCLTELKSMQ